MVIQTIPEYFSSNVVNSQMTITKNQRTPVQKTSRKRQPYTKVACVPCKSAKTKCDPGRPCKRCIQLGIEKECVDAERKKPAPRKKGGRKRKKSEMQSGSQSVSNDGLREYMQFIPQLQRVPGQPVGQPTQFSTTPLIPQQQFYPPNQLYTIPGFQTFQALPSSNGMFVQNVTPQNFALIPQYQPPNYSTAENFQVPQIGTSSMLHTNNPKTSQSTSFQTNNSSQGLLVPSTNQSVVLVGGDGQKKDDDNYDLYMNLSQLTPSSPSSTTQVKLVEDTPKITDGTQLMTLDEDEEIINTVLNDDKVVQSPETNLSDQSLTNISHIDDDKVINLVTKNASLLDRYNNENISKNTEKVDVSKKPGQLVVPISNMPGLNLLNDPRKIEELLRAIWMRQQQQQKEIEDLKDVLAKLQDLVLERNKELEDKNNKETKEKKK